MGKFVRKSIHLCIKTTVLFKKKLCLDKKKKKHVKTQGVTYDLCNTFQWQLTEGAKGKKSCLQGRSREDRDGCTCSTPPWWPEMMNTRKRNLSVHHGRPEDREHIPCTKSQGQFQEWNLNEALGDSKHLNILHLLLLLGSVLWSSPGWPKILNFPKEFQLPLSAGITSMCSHAGLLTCFWL